MNSPVQQIYPNKNFKKAWVLASRDGGRNSCKHQGLHNGAKYE
jgi:hypothetical protein